jgi:hypothetical protein
MPRELLDTRQQRLTGLQDQEMLETLIEDDDGYVVRAYPSES